MVDRSKSSRIAEREGISFCVYNICILYKKVIHNHPFSGMHKEIHQGGAETEIEKLVEHIPLEIGHNINM